MRIAETANLGPGSGYVEKPFGSEIKTKISMGSKYEFKPDKNPGAGQYDTTAAAKHVYPRSYEALIRGRDQKVPVGVDAAIKEKKDLPESGTGHLIPFGGDVKTRIGMGSKYVFKPDSNPPVGGYNTDRGFDSISPSKRSAVIK